MKEINKEELLQKYIFKKTNKKSILEKIKTLIVILGIVLFILIEFVEFNINIIFALLFLCMIFCGYFFLIDSFSNITKKIKYKICTNKIKKNEFYILKDSISDILKIDGRKENDSEPLLKVQFHNKNHWFYTDVNESINIGDEYYIILFKRGNYGHVFSGLLVNPKIIDFYECKLYNIEYIDNENYNQY